MESPRKFNDCYFYYYSTCTKGENCVFRHEPSALGCETMCTAWQQGKCLDKRCKLRHMELRKNRKQIPCYWETQPGGCRKKHCPFMHKNPDARTDGIAPSQPGPAIPTVSAGSEIGLEGPVPPMVAPPPPHAPAPVPLLWQQQRQVVSLDSAILGVLPGGVLGGGVLAGGEAVGRRVLEAPYALPVDPLVVNFDEESDNESAPSYTPTKTVSPEDAQRIARSKSQELLLLEKIQAESAAYFSYDASPHLESLNERKFVRANLSSRFKSLDELSGKNQHYSSETHNSLDFKVLSLDEIRATKQRTETAIHPKPITVNICRKRQLTSTHEEMTTSGNKIIKVVRSNSIVYKKCTQNTNSAPAGQVKVVKSPSDSSINRKRKLSELSDLSDTKDELIDDCHEFKKIKINEHFSKPTLIKSSSLCKDGTVSEENKPKIVNNDLDKEVQIVDLSETNVHVSSVSDIEIIDVDTAKIGEPVAVVDLSKDLDSESDVSISDMDLGLIKNFPDVVASCKQDTKKSNFNDSQKFHNLLSESL